MYFDGMNSKETEWHHDDDPPGEFRTEFPWGVIAIILAITVLIVFVVLEG